MVGAALDITNEDETTHTQFYDSYGLAIRIDAPGTLLCDYHTIQVPPALRGVKYATRQDELASNDLGTILSRREYRCDAEYTVALWTVTKELSYSLQSIMTALEQPKFVLYLGRKSCPLAVPLGAHIVLAETLREALEQVQWPIQIQQTIVNHVDIYWEQVGAGMKSGLDAIHLISRRDKLLSRKRWQFTDRQEYYSTMPIMSSTKEG